MTVREPTHAIAGNATRGRRRGRGASLLGVGLVAAALTGLAPIPVSAAPFEGQAALESETPDAKARRKAVSEARAAAFDAAVESLEASVDKAALAQARASLDVWTSSYRVLEMGAGRVRVEVEIDLPRLRKRLVPRPVKVARRVALAPVQIDPGCAAELGEPDAWVEGLRAAGLPLTDGADASAESIVATVSCSQLGPVLATHLQAARVVVQLRGGGAELRHEAFGFAVDIDEASSSARDRALTHLAPAIADRFLAPTLVRVVGVGDGSRVRRIERAIKDGVVGADWVQVVGLEAGGVVQVGVRGAVDVDGLARGLAELQFPDFRISVSANPDRGSVDVEIM